MPPGREVDMPNGEGNGSSPSWEELSRNPFAKGFDSIFSLVINWFWYAVTAVNCVSGKTKVRYFSFSISCTGPVSPSRLFTR